MKFSTIMGLKIADFCLLQVFVPTDICPELQQLCTQVDPTTGASYDMAEGGTNIFCINTSTILNCQGIVWLKSRMAKI